MAKRKSRKPEEQHEYPAHLLPCDEAPDPGWLLEQSRLAGERLERDLRQAYNELYGIIVNTDSRKQLLVLADKGFLEAKDRPEDERWSILTKPESVDVERDLPQAACILIVFHDDYQEKCGLILEPILSPKMRLKHGPMIQELRTVLTCCLQTGEDREIDPVTACMIAMEGHLQSDEPEPTTGSGKNEPNQEATMKESEQSKSNARAGIGRRKRRTEHEKLGMIASYKKDHPNATSIEISEKTGIHRTDVGRIAKKHNLKSMSPEKTQGKTRGYKNRGSVHVTDPSASCEICAAPLLESFYCDCCQESIVGQCKECHWTNTHPDKAMP